MKDKLYRFAVRMVGDMAQAEDIVQDVLIKIWNRRADWPEIHNIEAWGITLTKNRCIDYLRGSKKNEELKLEEGAFQIPAWEPSPEARLATDDLLQRIKNAMGLLPEKQAQVMQLRDVEGLSYQEIADALEIPMNQVKINLFRARQQIREVIIKSESYGL